MLNYGLYTRKSDDDRTVTEKSIRDQLTELKSLKEREGLHVVKTWEESMSAKIPNVRPDYTEMIKFIERGIINALLVWSINRLIRNMEEGGKLVQLFVDGKIKEIRTPFGTYRTGDNILPLVVEAASAAQFSIDHSNNVTRGMKGKFARGGCNYKIPQGYMNARDPFNDNIGIIVKDPQRFDLIRKAWDLFLTGSYTPVQVIDTLNNVWGYRTKQTKKKPSGPLGRNYGYYLFRTKTYLGYVKEKGVWKKAPEVEPMITPDEYARAQELMKRHKKIKQSRHTHDLTYTGLMRCGYCAQQVTGEVKKISSGLWENYHCSDSYGKCTKAGIPRKQVEVTISHALEKLTIDEDMCAVALRNIARDLDSQTGKIRSLYEQQNTALEQIESKLGNLADMWINGLMRDEQLYREKEVELTKERNNLVAEVEKMRNELERMRANAMAASNFVVFARDNFKIASEERKREIAHALGIRYVFYGKEKEIELEIHPLLVEIVTFAREAASSFALAESGYTKEKTGVLAPALSSGGPQEIRTPDPLGANEVLYQLS